MTGVRVLGPQAANDLCLDAFVTKDDTRRDYLKHSYELSKFVRELCVVLGPCNSDNERIMRAFLRDHLMMVLIPNFLENFLCHRGLNKRIIVAMRR